MNPSEIELAIKAVVKATPNLIPVAFESEEYVPTDETYCHLIISDNGIAKPSFGETRLGLIRFNIYQKKHRGSARLKAEAQKFFDLFPANSILNNEIRIDEKGTMYGIRDKDSVWDVLPTTIPFEVMDA